MSCAAVAEQATAVGEDAMDLSSKANQIVENVDYINNDLDENILPKVRELQDLSDQGLTPIANIGKNLPACVGCSVRP